MRVRCLLLTALAALGTVDLVISSPVNGGRSMRERIGPSAEMTIVERFRGGARACVIVQGDHDPIVDVDVHIFDEKGKLVAKDDSGGDLVAVIWYPPRDGNYTIRIKNHGTIENICYVSLK